MIRADSNEHGLTTTEDVGDQNHIKEYKQPAMLQDSQGLYFDMETATLKTRCLGRTTTPSPIMKSPDIATPSIARRILPSAGAFLRSAIQVRFLLFGFIYGFVVKLAYIECVRAGFVDATQDPLRATLAPFSSAVTVSPAFPPSSITSATDSISTNSNAIHYATFTTSTNELGTNSQNSDKATMLVKISDALNSDENKIFSFGNKSFWNDFFFGEMSTLFLDVLFLIYVAALARSLFLKRRDVADKKVRRQQDDGSTPLLHPTTTDDDNHMMMIGNGVVRNGDSTLRLMLKASSFQLGLVFGVAVAVSSISGYRRVFYDCFWNVLLCLVLSVVVCVMEFLIVGEVESLLRRGSEFWSQLQTEKSWRGKHSEYEQRKETTRTARCTATVM